MAGKIVVGIDPGKERHQAAVINEYGIQIGIHFRTNPSMSKSTWRKSIIYSYFLNPFRQIFK